MSVHADGAIYSYALQSTSVKLGTKIATSQSPPTCATFTGEYVFVGDCGLGITIYHRTDKKLQQFPGDESDEATALSAATCAPTERTVVVAAANRLRVFTFATQKGLWDESHSVVIKNLYSISTLAWKPDGTRLVAVS